MNDDELIDSEPGAIRKTLRDHFESERAAAPPVPARLAVLARDVSSPSARRVGLGVATACLVAIVAVSLFSLRPRADASPAAVVGRATANYLAVTDATLRVEIDSDALAFLDAILESEGDAAEPALVPRACFVDLAKPDRFVVRIADESGPGAAIAGCDGERLWSHDPVRKRAHLLDLGAGDEPPGFDLTRWLSFESFTLIAEESGRGSIVEIARDDAAGRRTFRLEPGASLESSGPVQWSRAVLVVDTKTDTIVEARIALRFGPLEIAEAKLTVLATNSGFGKDHFSPAANLPEGTRIVSIAIPERPPTDAEPIEIDEAFADEPPAIVLARTGLRFAEFESVLRRNLISTSTAYGLQVRAVTPDSPAARAGIQPGDIVMKWDGRPLRSTRELATWLAAAGAPTSVRVDLSRRKRTSLLSRKPWTDLSTTLVPLPPP